MNLSYRYAGTYNLFPASDLHFSTDSEGHQGCGGHDRCEREEGGRSLQEESSVGSPSVDECCLGKVIHIGLDAVTLLESEATRVRGSWPELELVTGQLWAIGLRLEGALECREALVRGGLCDFLARWESVVGGGDGSVEL